MLQAIGSSLEAWVTQVKREKAVYHVLNMCSVDVTRKVLVAEAWCPVSAKPRVQEALREAAHTTSASVRPPFRAQQCTAVSLIILSAGLIRQAASAASSSWPRCELWHAAAKSMWEPRLYFLL